MGNRVQRDIAPFVIWSSKSYISQESLVLHVAVLCLQTNSTINGGAKATITRQRDGGTTVEQGTKKKGDVYDTEQDRKVIANRNQQRTL